MADKYKCAQCFYWQSFSSNPAKGTCRHDAPLAYVGPEAPGDAIWPVTEGHEWCGDWSAREKADG